MHIQLLVKKVMSKTQVRSSSSSSKLTHSRVSTGGRATELTIQVRATVHGYRQMNMPCRIARWPILPRYHHEDGDEPSDCVDSPTGSMPHFDGSASKWRPGWWEIPA
jgi:hypothetical protein